METKVCGLFVMSIYCYRGEKKVGEKSLVSFDLNRLNRRTVKRSSVIEWLCRCRSELSEVLGSGPSLTCHFHTNGFCEFSKTQLLALDQEHTSYYRLKKNH